MPDASNAWSHLCALRSGSLAMPLLSRRITRSVDMRARIAFGAREAAGGGGPATTSGRRSGPGCAGAGSRNTARKAAGLGCAFGLFRQPHAAQLFRKQTKIEGFDEMQSNAGVPGFGAFVGLAPARHGNQQNASQGRERNARATSYPVISAGRIGFQSA